jgi:VanZ family protein
MQSSARRYLALLALGSVAFTLVGSLVPFQFQSRSWADASAAFVRAMTERLRIESKSDAIANVMLGIPLGFALLGLVCADRRVARWRAAFVGLMLLPGCAAFSAAVEFAQLYTLDRTCAGSDVLAQTVGAACGMVLWIGCGQWLTGQVRQAVSGQGTAVRFLIVYVLLLGFIEALPLDLSASPADAYRKLRRANPIPFHEFAALTGDAVSTRIATLLQLAGLYLPVGLLLAQLPGQFRAREAFGRVLLLSLGLALGMELGQVLVQSRTTSATDVVVGGSAAFFGWLLGRAFFGGLNFGAMFLLGALWWAALVWVSWSPFTVVNGPPVPFDWVPGMPLEGGNPLFALEEMLTKVVLFGLVGVVVGAWAYYTAGHAAAGVAVALGLLASALFEFGQTRFAGHTPCVTDVLLGGIGAFCGAWVTGKVRQGSNRAFCPALKESTS